MIKRIIDTWKAWRMLYKNKHALAGVKITDSIMKMALDVQQNGKPMLTKICAVDMSEEKLLGNIDIVSIWAGVGDANPIERVKHLRAQVDELKRLLRMCGEIVTIKDNQDLWMNIKIVLDVFE